MEELERVIHHANETKQRKCDTSQENNPTTEAKETQKTQSSRKAQKLKIDRVIENEDNTIGFVVRNVEYQSALFCALTTNGYSVGSLGPVDAQKERKKWNNKNPRGHAQANGLRVLASTEIRNALTSAQRDQILGKR